MVLRDLDKVKLKITKMSLQLEVGLHQLCDRKDLVIRPADKGRGIEIIDKKAYISELKKKIE